jgi:hypothetical protein
MPRHAFSQGPWLFSRGVDLGVFVGAAALSFAALGLGALTGDLENPTPNWMWVPAVIFCDVAHVWSTAFRTYLDPVERASRRWLLRLVPLFGFAASVFLYSLGEFVFWRTLAYLAIFHFVRQQYGWVALYRSRAGETGFVGQMIDTSAIYSATLWPLLYWHTHVPRRFDWFVAGDVQALPSAIMPIATSLYLAALVTYLVRALYRAWHRQFNIGKDVVVVTTAATWYVGIVAFDSDYAFTVTNVFMHGIPYFAIIFTSARTRASTSSLLASVTRSALPFLCALWLVAFIEELLWDRAVWHERSWLFGEPWKLDSIKWFVVPMLALPQLTHYVLDGFLWRRKSNPSVAQLASPPTGE